MKRLLLLAGAFGFVALAAVLAAWIISRAAKATPTTLTQTANVTNAGSLPPATSPARPALQTRSTLPPATSVPDPSFDVFHTRMLKKLSGDAEKRAGEALFDIKYSDPRKFAQLDWISGVPYKDVSRILKADSLPVLYDMLKDPKYAQHWPKIARIIGFVAYDAKDQKAVPELLAYFQRPEDFNSTGPNLAWQRLYGKLSALNVIGLVGGRQADETLRSALTAEGVRTLAKDWFESPLPSAVPKEEILAITSGLAAGGLVHSQDPQAIALVEALYTREAERCKASGSDSKLRNQLADAMIYRDIIADIGFDRYLHTLGTSFEQNEAEKHVNKYMFQSLSSPRTLR